MQKIVVQTNADFTPKGKRNARIVQTRGAMGAGRQLRWYVSGRMYNRLPVTAANVALTQEWMGA